MKFEKTDFEDAWVITKEPFRDNRGEFMRTFCRNEFEKYGLPLEFVQTNLSVSHKKHTLRGMHFQTGTAAEDKLVQCVHGSIYDVIIDLRKESKTYGKYFGIELSAENGKMLLVPKGFAHGLLTLTENVSVLYQVSSFYTPGSEQGIRWDDPAFAIQWPCSNPLVSEKDSSWKDYKIGSVAGEV